MDQKRLDAADKLWQSVHELDGLQMGPELLQKVNIEKASELLKSDPSIQKFFSVLLETLPDIKKGTPLTRPEEPFIPPEVWKAYQAYQTIIMDAYIVMTTLAHGFNSEKMLKNEIMKDAVVAALPSYAEFMDKYGHTGAYFLAKPIRACPSSKHLGQVSLFRNEGFGSSWFDVKPLVADGSSGGFGWSVS